MAKRKKAEWQEYRNFPVEELRIEQRAEGVRTLIGYAAVFDSWSEDVGGFREAIRPGAFSKTLSDGADVRALFNHDPNFVLGRTTSNTLRLSEDGRGLRIENDLPDTQSVRDYVISPIERGDINQMSFGFRAVKDKWGNAEDGDFIQRELFEVKLYDVSPVTFPAYPQTSVGVRALPVDMDMDEIKLAIFRHQIGAATDEDRALLQSVMEELRELVAISEEPRQEPHLPEFDEMAERLAAIEIDL